MTNTQEKHVISLKISAETSLNDDMKACFALCEEKLGIIPNVLTAYSFNENKLRNFTQMYNELLLGDSSLSNFSVK